MNILCIWTTVAVLYQTTICIVISWLTLSCNLDPNPFEQHEVTLMKLLYLYDPEICGRLYFYNYTLRSGGTSTSTIVWPIKNNVAASFRSKIRVWLTLHVIWTAFWLATITQRQRPCGFYASLLPFTLSGIALLIVDLVYATLFLMDTSRTGTESDILQYISSNKAYVRRINKTQSVRFGKLPDSCPIEDTSWVSLLFAYASIRGLVQWIANFWIVKDNYFEGLAVYHNYGYLDIGNIIDFNNRKVNGHMCTYSQSSCIKTCNL